MNHQTLITLTTRWGGKITHACDAIDAQLAGQRGPKPAVTTYALIAGLVYLALESKPVHLRGLHRELTSASSKDLTILGLRGRPTYRQLCYALELLHRHAENAPRRDQCVQDLLDAIVPPSATDSGPTTTWAIDTHLFEAWVHQKTSNSADPDATWRVLDTHKHKNRPVLGYQLIACVRTDTTEVCDRIAVTTANVDDAPPAAALALAMRNAGLPVQRILADRGFTQKPAGFLDPIRNAGIHLTYDLKEPDLGVSGTYHGNLIIDGWPYSPAIPKRLHRVPKPAPGSTAAQWAAYTKKMAEREPYRWLAHGKPQPNRARVASPASRNRLTCRIAKNTAPASAPICTVKHTPGEACALTTMTITAATAPRTYQYPAWGTQDWATLWKKRSAVERFFGHLQAPGGIGFDHGRFQVRRLTKVAIATAAFVIATNISLIERAHAKAAALAARPAKTRKTRNTTWTATTAGRATARTGRSRAPAAP